jgi:hypothetical protein
MGFTQRMMRISRIVLVPCFATATGGAALAGCAVSRHDWARDKFAQDLACPPDRVSVVKRPDLRSPPRLPAPPPDVAADPDRLAYWNKLHASEVEATQKAARNTQVFEVTGCGQQRIMDCDYFEEPIDQTPDANGARPLLNSITRTECGYRAPDAK